jgi:hypothetical protein
MASFQLRAPHIRQSSIGKSASYNTSRETQSDAFDTQRSLSYTGSVLTITEEPYYLYKRPSSTAFVDRTVENNLPDFKNDFRLAVDFIFSTRLCRKALEWSFPGGIANVIRDVLKGIDSLALSCHLPEFTDHSLPHLISLVHRASEWTLLDDGYLVDFLEPSEAALLVLALLTHDMGMLSQDPLDLEGGRPIKGFSNVALWVRRTHCLRLPRLLRRTLESFGHHQFVASEFFNLLCRVAMAHEEWSWQNSPIHYTKISNIAPIVALSPTSYFNPNRAFGIAAAVAVCDLLDEDAQRCDTETLLLHRQGGPLNKAHWIRHLLTRNRVMIQRSKFSVVLGWLRYDQDNRGEPLDQDPSDCQNQIKRQQVLNALMNQFSSVLLYNDDLSALDADLKEPEFRESDELVPIPWNLPSLREFWGCAPERLLQSIFKFAVKPEAEILKKWSELTGSAAFRKLNLDYYDRFLSISGDEIEPHLDEEVSFKSIIEPSV